MGRPQVSVIVPTYNRLEWLPAVSQPELRQIANRQLRSHLAEFLRRALRHGSPRQIARIAVALGRV
jgi:hypothetical protein